MILRTSASSNHALVCCMRSAFQLKFHALRFLFATPYVRVCSSVEYAMPFGQCCPASDLDRRRLLCLPSAGVMNFSAPGASERGVSADDDTRENLMAPVIHLAQRSGNSTLRSQCVLGGSGHPLFGSWKLMLTLLQLYCPCV